jgi:hypothetical protein
MSLAFRTIICWAVRRRARHFPAGSVPIRQLDAGPGFDEGAHEDHKGTAEKEVAFPAACPIALSRQHGPQQKSPIQQPKPPGGRRRKRRRARGLGQRSQSPSRCVISKVWSSTTEVARRRAAASASCRGPRGKVGTDVINRGALALPAPLFGPLNPLPGPSPVGEILDGVYGPVKA